jgi:hypothetical protein
MINVNTGSGMPEPDQLPGTGEAGPDSRRFAALPA